MGYCHWVRGPQALEVCMSQRGAGWRPRNTLCNLVISLKYQRAHQTRMNSTHTHRPAIKMTVVSSWLPSPWWNVHCACTAPSRHPLRTQLLPGAGSDSVLLTSRWYVKPVVTSLVWQQPFPGQPTVVQRFVKHVTGKGNPWKPFHFLPVSRNATHNQKPGLLHFKRSLHWTPYERSQDTFKPNL